MLANWSKLSDTACSDRDPKVLFDGRDELAHTLIEASVDLVRSARAGIGDEEVPWNREQRQAVVGHIGVQDHDHVAIDAVDALRAQAVVRVLHRERAPRR